MAEITEMTDGVQGECAFDGGATVQVVYSNGCGLNPLVDACTGLCRRAPEREGFIFLEQSIGLRGIMGV